jgi:hypothetical protein
MEAAQFAVGLLTQPHPFVAQPGRGCGWHTCGHHPGDEGVARGAATHVSELFPQLTSWRVRRWFTQ